MAKLAAIWFVWSLVLAVLYVLLVGQLKGAEVGAGVICGSLAAVAYTTTRYMGKLQYAFRLSWLLHLAKLPVMAFSDTAIVFGVLWRALVLRRPTASRFLTIPFDFGGQDAASALRRALVTAGISFAPNTFVVSADQDKGLLLLHQLAPGPKAPGIGDTEWPL